MEDREGAMEEQSRLDHKVSLMEQNLHDLLRWTD